MMSASTADTARIVAFVAFIGLCAGPLFAAATDLAQSSPLPAPQLSPPSGAAALPPEPEQLPRTAWLQNINLGALVAAPLMLLALYAFGVLRPGALGGGGKSGTGGGDRAHPWFLWLFAALVVYVTSAFGAAIALAVPSWWEKVAMGDLRRAGLLAIGQYTAGILAAWCMLRLASGKGAAFAPKDAGLGLVAFVLGYPIVAASSVAATWVASKVTGSTPDPLAHQTLSLIVKNLDNPWTWAVIAGAVIGAPILEEVIYRGFVQKAVAGLVGKGWWSVMITSTIFAAMHWSAVPPHALVPLWVLGVALGVAAERTGRLGPAIIMHAAFNALNVALAIAMH